MRRVAEVFAASADAIHPLLIFGATTWFVAIA
jgi:hypothetical protein